MVVSQFPQASPALYNEYLLPAETENCTVSNEFQHGSCVGRCWAKYDGEECRNALCCDLDCYPFQVDLKPHLQENAFQWAIIQ
jgi:hypothetical protein